MPFTVITLKNTPKSLRGDLTKWMQEISTGVYVGNFNSKVREELWNRVLESTGIGEATISYYYRNEIGYNFETQNTDRQVIDFEGIPLIITPKENKKEEIIFMDIATHLNIIKQKSMQLLEIKIEKKPSCF